MGNEKYTERQWNIIEAYCNGERNRDIMEKFTCHDGYVSKLAREMGILPRPEGFASYVIAHQWVLKAREEFKKLRD